MPIFDQGYQHWQGPLSGHAWRWLAIAQHGIRVQSKNRILRLLLLVAWLPAIGLVTAVALWGLVEQRNENVLAFARNFLPQEILQDPVTYRAAVWTLFYSFFFKTEMFFIMLLVIIAGPGLISRDLRFNALPLYFARPLTRFDYFLGKLGVIGALVAAVAVVPAVFAYVVGVCFSLDLTVIRDMQSVVAASVGYGLVITLSTGTLMLALSSLSRRSLYVAIAFPGIWIISGSVGSIMPTIYRQSLRAEIFPKTITRLENQNRKKFDVPNNGVLPDGSFMRHDGFIQHPEIDPETGQPKLTPMEPEQAEKMMRWQHAREQAYYEAHMEAQRGLAEALRSDWRPLLSYVANLERVGEHLLDTDTAWYTFGKAVLGEAPPAAAPAPGAPPRRGPRGPGGAPMDARGLAAQMVTQYPWWWSAAVLAALVGLSTWTLSFRVKSLDQLK